MLFQISNCITDNCPSFIVQCQHLTQLDTSMLCLKLQIFVKLINNFGTFNFGFRFFKIYFCKHGILYVRCMWLLFEKESS